MCGIAGIIANKSLVDVNNASESLSDSLKLRGPDGNGQELFNLENNFVLSLIHRRLSI